MEVFREFRFEAAHRLPHVPEGHKCARLHGHSFRVEVRVSGEVDPETGMVMDFSRLEEAFAPLHNALDHRYLNEVDGLDNPTSENLAGWVWERLASALPLTEVVVRETCTSGVAYHGPGQHGPRRHEGGEHGEGGDRGRGPETERGEPR